MANIKEKKKIENIAIQGIETVITSKSEQKWEREREKAVEWVDVTYESNWIVISFFTVVI